ncbi:MULTISPECIES: ROK family protein [unclassified Lactobacillus]|uniref:ROK family protein n=1 Tax=unclassified Lactobacillus TaxID=2620435 RepID=UPI000EFBA167|nr:MULTISPECIES: ROK family protein [unclassified Lactobacillus]RMC39173.1 ROK family protein [Lactobacillus sp. ESL0237]RMC43456.1 ROK family protein [Lactobacillus sp. ESL0234]RMC44369.1 ROK family protein [Lactobacillus sp. ESL0236]RMC46805.1 ROK family protein [Lactobacillus sp. ESL0230]RMC49468.1 ROK family protein [Lactobacillus sp. ESL0225]
MIKLGSIEAGGTKFVCSVSDKKLNIIAKTRILTTVPDETMSKIYHFFQKNQPDAIGIGCFGPIGMSEGCENYGKILATPKKGWVNYPFLEKIQSHISVPVFWTTDVNAAAYGEYKLGAGKGLKNIIYWTVGTGIGAGAICNGKILNGVTHSEMGHILVVRNQYDHTEGTCIYHYDCLESLASGPAIEKRVGTKAENLSKSSKQWDMEAYYLAQACVNATMILSPERIIFGGGVSNQEQLFPKIRYEYKKMVGQYLETTSLDKFIVHAKLGNDAGTIGCLLLAKEVLAI